VIAPALLAYLQANLKEYKQEPEKILVPVPKVAIGVSGGGKRALYNGAGTCYYIKSGRAASSG
jgi:hypothetical protein